MTISDELAQATDEQRIRLIEKQVESMVDDLFESYSKNRGNRYIAFRRLFTRQSFRYPRNRYLKDSPETFVEERLIWPILSMLRYDYETEVWLTDDDRADFKITNTPEQIIGEHKKLGNIEDARGQIIRYLTNSDYRYGIIADGLYWEFVGWDGEHKQDPLNRIYTGDLRGVVADYVTQDDFAEGDVIDKIANISTISPERFYKQFNKDNVARTL
jgi:predicted type IV restriction endonuclease